MEGDRRGGTTSGDVVERRMWAAAREMKSNPGDQNLQPTAAGGVPTPQHLIHKEGGRSYTRSIRMHTSKVIKRADRGANGEGNETMSTKKTATMRTIPKTKPTTKGMQILTARSM